MSSIPAGHSKERLAMTLGRTKRRGLSGQAQGLMGSLGLLLALCLFVAASLTREAGPKKSQPKEKTVRSIQMINPKPYADLQATSFLPFTGKISGTVVWSRDKSPELGERIPIHLAIRNEMLIVSYGDHIEARNRNDGSRLWGRDTSGGVSFDMTSDGISTVNHANFYRLLGFDGVFGEGLRLPYLVNNPSLDFIKMDSGELRLVYHSPGSPATDRGMETIPAQMLYSRYHEKEQRFIWTFQKEGFCQDVRISSDLKQIFMASRQNIFSFPFDANSESQVRTLEMPGLMTFSLDHEGPLLVVQKSVEGLRLTSLDLSGRENWAYSQDVPGTIPHPPASAPGGRVYLMIDSVLHCFASGELAWEFSFPRPETGVWFSVLADHTILAGVSRLLMQISEDGKPLLNKPVDTPITCRPIIDEKGRVYIAGQGGIFCLK